MDVNALAQEAFKKRQNQFSILSRTRTAELMEQAEAIKPLLKSADPETVLRASQELRDIHKLVEEIQEFLANWKPKRKWSAKRRARQVAKVNHPEKFAKPFRPQ